MAVGTERLPSCVPRRSPRLVALAAPLKKLGEFCYTRVPASASQSKGSAAPSLPWACSIDARLPMTHNVLGCASPSICRLPASGFTQAALAIEQYANESVRVRIAQLVMRERVRIPLRRLRSREQPALAQNHAPSPQPRTRGPVRPTQRPGTVAVCRAADAAKAMPLTSLPRASQMGSIARGLMSGSGCGGGRQLRRAPAASGRCSDVTAQPARWHTGPQ